MAAVRKITNRAFSVLLIAAMVIFGMTVYLLKYIDHGQEWALYFSGKNSGATGQLVDRNGIMLASFTGEENLLSPDEATRIANYHVTGDYFDRTGTGIVPRFRNDMQNFSILTGTTHASDSTMVLNIDARLNNLIYSQLSNYEKPGMMMLCNYRTGELLGMVSTPSLDPENIGDMDLLPDGVFLNRCLSAAFTPGSIFKLVTAAAAIENMADIDSRSFYCEEEDFIAGVPITCMAAHYTQTFEKALSNSCNIAFAHIAVDIGQDTLVNYVRQYGFLDSHQLDGLTCIPGSFPVEFVGDPETGWAGIGQSTDMVCPYSELRFICAIANGGSLIEPMLIRSENARTVQLITPSTANRLASMMSYNAVDHYDAENNFPGLNICAKTGTAELGDGDSHSWFVGFLADEEHPYAFVTLVERGGFGITVAGSITNTVLQWAVENIE